MRNALVLGLVLCAWGCRGADERAEAARTLPFVVKVNEVEVVQIPDETAETPPDFGDGLELMRGVAASLREAGVFTEVITEDEPGFPADLELDITIRGSDFGRGEVRVGGAAFSTIVWLFAGHLSWLIDNRHYPDSDVRMNVEIHQTRQPSDDADKKPTASIFQDDLFLKGLELSFSERADMARWFLNIITPPWWGDGDSRIRGASLAEKTVEFFEQNGPSRILTRLPGDHHQTLACSLVYDPANGEIIVMAREPAIRVRISSSESAPPRALKGAEVALLEVPETDRGEVRLRLSQLDAGISLRDEDILYRIPLQDEEVGWVRVQAALERRVGRWTIYRPPSKSQLPPAEPAKR